MGSFRRDGSGRQNSDAMPCDIAQMCSATIITGGRGAPSGRRATSFSVASRSTPKARSFAAASPGWSSGARRVSNIAA